MAKVFLLSAAPAQERTPFNLGPLTVLQASARCDPFGVHTLTDYPAAADLILFADLDGAGLHFEAIRRHPLVKRYREKCFIFCSNAFVIPFLPGVYASIEKRWASRRTLAGFHVGTLQNEFASFTPATDDLPYLFSFIGSTVNAPVRQRVRNVSHPRAFFRDTAAEFARISTGRMDEHERRDYFRQYVEVTKASKFVLCPRGLGVATIRLVETLKMGRVPVIISDNWVEPVGPDWGQFSVRIRERDVHKIPGILEARESEAIAMGHRARSAWEQWFSDEVAFHRVVEACLQIRACRRMPEAIARWPAYLQLLRPLHLRFALRRPYRAARKALQHRAQATSTASAGASEHCHVVSR
ncbi:MAG: exostosin family protein [Chthoniobacterales bacterium]